MIEKLRAFFLNPRKGKSRRTGLILTIVALVEILAIMLVSTSAWVESISSIKIFTTIQDDPNGTKGIVQSAINQQVEMNEGSSGTYDLSQYFRPSGAFHFAPASSVDGKTMYFPEHRGGSTTNFRIGSISDKNVNYIAFTIRTKESNPVSLAFDKVPTISFGGTALNQNDETSKLVRFAIGDNSGNFKVFSLYKEKFTEQVPAAETIVPTSTADPKEGYAYTTVYPFKDFVKGKDRACQTTANGTLSFSMWIQDPTPTATTSAVYNNKTLSVSNLKLIIVKPFVVKSTYKSGNSYVVDTNGVSGTVAIENGDYGKEAIYYAVPGVSIDLHAIASEANGYQFMGWSNTLSNTSVFASSSVDPYSYTVTSSGTTAYALEGTVPTLYAKFNDEHDLYLKPDFKHIWNNNNNLSTSIRYAAYVFGRDPVTGEISGAWYNMTASGNYFKCTYKGSATSVIFCYMDPNDSTNAFEYYDSNNVKHTPRWLQTYDLSVPARPGNYYYVVTCRQVLDDITANGVTYDNPRNAEITQSGSHDFGTNKLLGYWEHNNVEVQVAKTSNSPSGADNRKYCALTNTVKNQSTSELSISNYKVVYHAWWYQDAASVKLDGTVYQDYYGADDPDHAYEPIPQYKFEKNVTLTAEDNAYYVFDGWYENQAGTGTSLGKGTETAPGVYDLEITAPDNGTYSGSSNNTVTKKYYAKFSERPETWQIKYGTTADNWPVTTDVALNNTSGSTYTGTISLTNGQEIWLKVYDYKNGTWYGNGGEYVDYIKTTLVSNATLTTTGGNIHLKSGFAGTATYTFTFNSSNKQLTITASGTVPTVKLWSGASDTESPGTYNSMTRSATNSNVMTYSKTLTEGQELFFKVNDQTRGIWYTNKNGTASGYYDGYTTSPLVSNSTLTTSGNNMYIHAHAGTYKFSFDYSTKQLSIEVTSWSDITLTFDANSATWATSGAVITFYDDSGEVKLTTSGNTASVTIKSNRGNGTNVGFNRWQSWTSSTNHGTWWNGWNNSACGSRGFSTTYYATGDGAGHW